MASEPYAEPALPPGVGADEPGPHSSQAPIGGAVEAQGPWRLAMRRLRRNKVALFFGGLFILDTNHLTEKIEINGQPTNVVSLDGIPIGPGPHAKFLLGADPNGRDVMVRLMYGGRTSIFIGVAAAFVTTILAVIAGIISAYYRGWPDAVISRAMDVIWAFPVLLLGIALGTALSVSGSGLQLGFLTVPEDSIWIPILIIGFVYIPYMARPIRGEVLGLREKEFVEASIAQGAGALRIMFSEILPNLVSTIIVFFTLNIANNMLLESALSFLGAGVRPPHSSWGSMVSEGYGFLSSSPHLTLIPGLMIVLTVLSLNVFGDGLRDALDPRAKVRLEAAAAEEMH
jgi:peptide/nickel transport system permease protein